MSQMSRVVLLGAVVAVVAARAEQPAVRQAEIEKQLRRLEKEIEKVRELSFKSPVVARVIARPKRGAEGVQGYYDTKQKALFLYDDIRGITPGASSSTRWSTRFRTSTSAWRSCTRRRSAATRSWRWPPSSRATPR